ncbi:MBL fold metallo-hydrolase [Ornithinibacillus salinisoli]|uniref:MBL fold metallo-hydrolase n=1 Tax=Ornithinibacillus salinisoli TaxID=1848459 RepID=A0ABW4VVP8_9BACI
MTHSIITILGTAQDGGIPHPNCFCENCTNAIRDPAFKRNAASLAIILPEENKWHLIDATPDLKEQLARLQIKHSLQGNIMESIFLTHAHVGHYPGLLFLGRETMNTDTIPVFAGEKMKNLLEQNNPWSQLTELKNIRVKKIADGQLLPISDRIIVKPIAVPHRNEFSETFGFWIEGSNKKVLYIPDIDRWDEWDINIYDACMEADICLLDGTFYAEKELQHIHRDFHEIPHPLMTETMNRLQDLTSKTEIFFTHFNHSNPAIHADGKVKEEIEGRGFKIAVEGMEIII